ncbi:hypothetical protein NKG05_08430 [Oerskovia sp. M15]
MTFDLTVHAWDLAQGLVSARTWVPSSCRSCWATPSAARACSRRAACSRVLSPCPMTRPSSRGSSPWRGDGAEVKEVGRGAGGLGVERAGKRHLGTGRQHRCR